jgi:drug/metabolite transporter (DMT)-like permease
MIIGELRGRVGLFRLTRWQMIAAFLMTAMMASLLSGWKTIGRDEAMLLAASSLFGIMIATTTYFAAIYTAGPRVTALLFSLTSPFALVFGYAALGETITSFQGFGVALVLSGVVLAIAAPQPASRGASLAARPRLPWNGIALGVVTALGQALGNLFARPAMAAGVEPFTAMAFRSGLAAVFFIGLSAFPFARTDRQPFVVRSLGLAVASSFFGTGLGMSLLMAALRHGNVGVVSTLSSIAPVVILPMIWVRTGVAPTWTAWVGAALAIAGTALISIG